MRTAVQDCFVLMNWMHPRKIGNDTKHLMDMQLSKLSTECDLFIDIQFLVSKKDNTALGDQTSELILLGISESLELDSDQLSSNGWSEMLHFGCSTKELGLVGI
jgi:hypothetical protein